MFRIPQGTDKSKTDKTVPMAPEFALWLDKTPIDERIGYVFNPKPKRSRRLKTESVGQVIVEIGKASGIVVNEDSNSFVSAHDLRRSFGSRWARRLMPAELMEVMRHQSINTTLKFYIDIKATETADKLWRAYEADQESKQ